MKVFSSSQIREWDKATIEEQNISSHALMERAAHACLTWVKNNFSEKTQFYIFCGNGNNGGDGLALTRLLIEDTYDAKAILVNSDNNFSEDAKINLKLLEEYEPQHIANFSETLLHQIPQNAVIIDAIFGTGLNRNIDGAIAGRIELLNTLSCAKISIDIPSGLFTDTLPDEKSVIFKADYTLSFQVYKRSFLHPESAKYAGKIQILNIRLNTNFEEKTDSDFYTSDINFIRGFYKTRNPFSHKGTFGTAILVGGSYGKIGAIAMSTKAALRSGAGKVFIQSPQCGYEILQTLVPEAMFEPAGENYIEHITANENAVIGIGPGFGTDKKSVTALWSFLSEYTSPLVIDADALNIISENKNLLSSIQENSIITPHPKEFERLFGAATSTVEQANVAVQKAIEHKIIIVLKGHRTAICTPQGKCFYNLTGNAGMATAGSGDVLTGIITGLLAQGYTSEEAALLGVYIHGLSGDIAAKILSQEALIAGDIIDNLGKAFLQIQQQDESLEFL
ncbi:MAG: NAD(P)H-hydrate dehydratase [Arachidicoccus sp.]|nr:NAD(P)H-hydrate dehydratase [Arachidicoccus sp.]